MATLKISDLSVGDWVMVEWPDGERWRGRLTGLSEAGGIEVSCANGKHVRCSSNFISSIPITAEILEKIGWERYNDEYCQFVYFCGNMKIISNDSMEWIITIYDEEWTKSMIRTRISQINQLQHALRLAGVEKEINL